MTLNYAKTLRGVKQSVEEVVRLVTTKTNFGGERYWFACPSCGRRCAELHLPAGELHFFCRVCYNLTYQSSNESHKFDGMFAMLAGRLGCSLQDVKRVLLESSKR